MTSYPIISDMPIERCIEFFVGKHFANLCYGENIEIKLGNDSTGVPDVFVFQNNRLISTIELTGYVFSAIEDLRSHSFIDGVQHINVEKCTSIHEEQPPPFTIIEKKIKGNRLYKRYEDAPLILLIYSDVRFQNGSLVFASIGPMQISPSCNNFSHYRTEIIEELKTVVKKSKHDQWDEIWLVDYTLHINSLKNCPKRIDSNELGS